MFSSFLTPAITERLPGLARAIPWIFVFDALMVIATIVAVISLMRFRARLTPEEARRVAEIVSFRRIHRDIVRGRRLFIGSVVVLALAMCGLLLTGGLTPILMEFFTVVLFAALYIPFYFIISLLERAFGMTAGRIEELVKQPSRHRPIRHQSPAHAAESQDVDSGQDTAGTEPVG